MFLSVCVEGRITPVQYHFGVVVTGFVSAEICWSGSELLVAPLDATCICVVCLFLAREQISFNFRY